MPSYSWQNLARRLHGIKSPVGVELGVHRGEFSRRILTAVPGLHLYMVDAWSRFTYSGKDEAAAHPDKIRLYQDEADFNYNAALNVAREFSGRVNIIRKFSDRAAILFDDGEFDFVYIDAAHDKASVKQDGELWLPKVKKGGYLCGHDYGGEFTGVKAAVDEMFGDRVESDSDFTWWMRV